MFIIYLIFMNILSYCFMFIDKKRAIKKKQRIPESSFSILALFGAFFGIIIASKQIHHKNNKISFKVKVMIPAIVFCLITYLNYKYQIIPML